MAALSDGDLTTVVTCEGDLKDPQFVERFDKWVGKLNHILGEVVKVHKLEPWNSVRVTLSIPREAALRLRKLASEGAAQLRALGILSVQVEGDQVISLRLASSSVSAEAQEIRLTTAATSSSVQDGSSGSSQADGVLGRFLGAPPPEFKSPNVVCPPDGVVPVPPPTTVPSVSTTTKTFGGPFPFTSMNQAIHSQQVNNYATPPTPSQQQQQQQPPPPPPPYPGKSPAVTLSSPLLVNLLQNDGKVGITETTPPPPSANPVSAVMMKRTPVNRILNRTVVQQKNTINNNNNKTQASASSMSTSTSISPPSALNNNTSISKTNSTTITNILPPYPSSNRETLPPPPPYSVAVNNRQWDSVVQSSPFLDLTPSLTDLKSDDLEHLLPTLERDLARSPPPEIPEELTHSNDKKNFLINPLTGELEPQSSCESDTDDLGDVFTGLPSPADLSDEDTNSTIRPDTTDQSDSETRSSHSDSGKHRKTKVARDRGRDSPNLKPTEKIKLRLKLEKTEPTYKVDVSFIQQQQPKKAMVTTTTTSAAAAVATTPPTTEELRVPPLHISLRGRNHAFITNKKKEKLSSSKMSKVKSSAINEEHKKSSKSNHEYELSKQKERRGSDSELSRNNLKFDSNGIISVEKKRRLSQSEIAAAATVEMEPIVGSTNIGTITNLPQKPRKDKNKIKDIFKSKDVLRSSKSFSKTLGEKFTKQVVLPTGEIDMEAKFKQRLMEGVQRPPHRTEATTETGQNDKVVEQVIKIESEPPPLQEKEDKCNSKQPPDLTDKVVNHHHHHQSRSPNGGAQGEDSGIESMDALSEKSPNQASQSPHADIPESSSSTTTTTSSTKSLSTTPNHEHHHVVEDKSNEKVPEIIPSDMLDIEAQLAKMEGLNGVEDVNENNCMEKIGQCCELTTPVPPAEDGGGSEKMEVADVVPVKSKTKEDDLEPLPVRVTPPLYTYSNPEKTTGRTSPESPSLSDEDSNSCSTTATPTNIQQQHNNKTKSLLEQLLIEIPTDNSNSSQTPSSPSPATRSMRTRAHSKVGSPELNSPSTTSTTSAATTTTTTSSSITTASKPTRAVTPANTTKRKRHESDSSNTSVDDIHRNKKPRKCSENAAELIKACMGVDGGGGKANNVKKGVGVATPPTTTTGNVTTNQKLQDESSDSDEPLIEKVRKTAAASGATTNNSIGKKVKSGGVKTVSTRRSVRTTTATNTRSKGDRIVAAAVASATETEAAALRRKTRSAVSEGDSKRKKEVK